MNKTHWIALIIAIILIVFWVWNGRGGGPTSEEVIRVGISTILSGDLAILGDNIVKTAELVVEEINESGGIDGRQIELIIQDAGLDSKSGLNASQKLVNVDGIKYIIGGTSSNGTLAAAPLVNQNKVIYLTPVTGGRNVDEAGEYIFRTANSDILSGRDIAEAMIGLGYKKVAVVAEVTEATLDTRDAFQNTLKNSDIRLVVSEEFQPKTTDFRTQIAKIKSDNPDAVYVESQTGIAAAHFIKQARELGLDTDFFTDFRFAFSPEATEIVGDRNGIYFPDPAYSADSKDTEEFFEKYEEKYGIPSPIPFHSATTRDAIVLLVKAIEDVGDDSEKVHDWLVSDVKNWTGLMGTYSLDKKGNSDLGFIVKQIQNGEFVELK